MNRSDIQRAYADGHYEWALPLVVELEASTAGASFDWVKSCFDELLAASDRVADRDTAAQAMHTSDIERIHLLAESFEARQSDKLCVGLACLLVARILILKGSLPRAKFFLIHAMEHFRDYCQPRDIEMEFVFDRWEHLSSRAIS